ncbi:MAG TPA: YbhB/YbcL family Raf kinase inhibitor-like protein [Phycisphaerae bacterium]|nr:YbhB/YbcL family Raf kinase inhibitor-like protein [Phycisphaerae bacterium]
MTSASRSRFPGPRRQFWLESPAFADGATIPPRHTADGENVSVPLAWGNVPPACRQLVLLMEDPDAYTADPWVHWLLYGISPSATSLPEACPPDAYGARAGLNSWSGVGYRGPQPPPGSGLHRYRFRLLAVDADLDLASGLRRQQLLDAAAGHVIAEAALVGLYGR